MYNMLMARADFVVSTVALARTKLEAKTILDTLRLLSKINIPIVVADGGSPKKFLNEIRKIHNVIIEKKKKDDLFSQVKQSLYKASKLGRAIFYLESNKYLLVKTELPKILKKAKKIITKDPEFGLILISRNKKSFETFPKFQRAEEQFLNKLTISLLHLKKTDYSYGPRILNSSHIKYLKNIHADLGWGWPSFILFTYHKLRKKIYSISVDGVCPVEERVENEEDQRYRLRQLKENLKGIELSLNKNFIDQ